MTKHNYNKIFVAYLVFGMSTLLFSVMQSSLLYAQKTNDKATESVVGTEDTYLPITVHSVDDSEKSVGCEGIQEAIDSLPPTGGKVILMSGVFTCTTAIVIDHNNINLEGQGDSTMLRLANNANSPVIVIGQTVTPPITTVRNVRVANLVIDGNRQNQEFECWTGACGNRGLTEIRNNGLTLRNVSDVLIENVTSDRNRSGGLVTERISQRITVRNFSASDNEFDGIAGYLTEESLFTGLYLHNNVAAGLSFDLDFQKNVISNAVITGNGSVGIFMVDAHDNLFNNIQLHNSGQHAIFLAQNGADSTSGASGNTFSNIVVSGLGSAGWCFDGEGVYAFCINNISATNNLLFGAQFIDTNGNCIKQPEEGLLTEAGTICR